jgi:hypothetical protein
VTAADRGILVELYDTDATTRLAVLEQAADAAWQDVLSRQGQCTFSLAVDDAKRASLTDGRFVRLSWNGLAFGHRLSPTQTWQHQDNRGRVVYSGPGLASLLDDAVLYPEYFVAGDPIGRYTEDVRGFGPYSKPGSWLSGDAGWNAPAHLDYSSDAGRRQYKPKVFKKLAPHADWISVNGAYHAESPGYVWWARKLVTLDADTDCMLVYTGDNFVDQWIDGRLWGQADEDVRGWRKAKRIRLRLTAGDHVLCARIENAPGSSSPTAYIAALVSLKDNGDPDEVLAKTGPNWNIHTNDPEPGWFAGNVLRRFASEAVDRSVRGALTLDYGFTTTQDSAANDWTGDRITFERPLGTAGVEFAAACAEFGIDWHVDWTAGSAPELNVHNRRGVSRTSGSGTIKLHLPAGLSGYTTTRTHARRTALLGQRANGRWVERLLGVGAAGRMETSGAVSGAGSEGTLAALVDTLLRRSSTAKTDVNISATALVGPQPGSDFDPLGDTIWVPGHLGLGHIKARCLGVSVAQQGDKVIAFPLFTLDESE